MSYADDELRKQRHLLPKSKIGMSSREMLEQKKTLNQIVTNNKKIIEKGVEAEQDKAKVIAQEALKRFEKKTAMNSKDADQKTQEVIDYYKN